MWYKFVLLFLALIWLDSTRTQACTAAFTLSTKYSKHKHTPTHAHPKQKPTLLTKSHYAKPTTFCFGLSLILQCDICWVRVIPEGAFIRVMALEGTVIMNYCKSLTSASHNNSSDRGVNILILTATYVTYAWLSALRQAYSRHQV